MISWIEIPGSVSCPGLVSRHCKVQLSQFHGTQQPYGFVWKLGTPKSHGLSSSSHENWNLGWVSFNFWRDTRDKPRRPKSNFHKITARHPRPRHWCRWIPAQHLTSDTGVIWGHVSCTPWPAAATSISLLGRLSRAALGWHVEWLSRKCWKFWTTQVQSVVRSVLEFSMLSGWSFDHAQCIFQWDVWCVHCVYMVQRSNPPSPVCSTMFDTWRLYRKPRGYGSILIKRKRSKP